MHKPCADDVNVKLKTMMVESMIIVFSFSGFYMYDFFMADLLVKGTVS
jgi:hypothetical protein